MNFAKLLIVILMVLSGYVAAAVANSADKSPGSQAKARKPAHKKSCPNTLGTDLPFFKGIEIKIVKYLPETMSYQVVGAASPDEGINDSTLEGLASSVSEIKYIYEDVIKDPEKIVGNVYESNRDVPSLTEEELEARRGCQR